MGRETFIESEERRAEFLLEKYGTSNIDYDKHSRSMMALRGEAVKYRPSGGDNLDYAIVNYELWDWFTEFWYEETGDRSIMDRIDVAYLLDALLSVYDMEKIQLAVRNYLKNPWNRKHAKFDSFDFLSNHLKVLYYIKNMPRPYEVMKANWDATMKRLGGTVDELSKKC